MQQQDNSQKMVIVATLAFILGFGLAWLILSQKGGSVAVNGQSTTTPSQSELSTTTGANFVQVPNQAEGVSVEVPQVKLDRLGWVVIHEDDNGAPGRILGAQLYDAGTSSGSVDLLRGTIAGNKYYAMLHEDNGDRAFDPKKDTPILGADGNPVMTSFMATAGSSSQ